VVCVVCVCVCGYVCVCVCVCAMPNVAVFCSSLISCFPDRFLGYFLVDFEMVPAAPIIIIIIIIFIINLITFLSVSAGKSSPIADCRWD